MKRFDFPLDRVRKWPHDQVELEELKLQQLYAMLRALEDKREALVREEQANERAVLSKGAIYPQELMSLDAFRHYVVRKQAELNAFRKQIELQIANQQAVLLEAHRRFRLLDGLRDKALVTWTAARDKETEELAAELFLAKRNREMD